MTTGTEAIVSTQDVPVVRAELPEEEGGRKRHGSDGLRFEKRLWEPEIIPDGDESSPRRPR